MWPEARLQGILSCTRWWEFLEVPLKTPWPFTHSFLSYSQKLCGHCHVDSGESLLRWMGPNVGSCRTNPLMDAVDRLPQLWKCPWTVGFIPTGFLDVWNVSAWDRVTLAIYTGVCDGVRLHNRNDIHLTQYGEVSRTLIDDPWSTVSLEHRRRWMH